MDEEKEEGDIVKTEEEGEEEEGVAEDMEEKQDSISDAEAEGGECDRMRQDRDMLLKSYNESRSQRKKLHLGVALF